MVMTTENAEISRYEKPICGCGWENKTMKVAEGLRNTKIKIDTFCSLSDLTLLKKVQGEPPWAVPFLLLFMS